MVYLGAGIDKKDDVFSGVIATFSGQVCDIYLGKVVSKEGFDIDKFNSKLSECVDYKPANIYFYFPKYWRRASVPILFLKGERSEEGAEEFGRGALKRSEK